MIIRNTRYEDVRQVIRLERRISDIERLVGFLVDMMLGLISAFFAHVSVQPLLMAVLIGSTRSAQASGVFDFNVGYRISFSERDAMVFEIVLPALRLILRLVAPPSAAPSDTERSSFSKT